MIEVTVVYRSGAMLTFECENIETKRNQFTGELTSIAAEGIPKGTIKPFLWGIDHIDAVWTRDK